MQNDGPIPKFFFGMKEELNTPYNYGCCFFIGWYCKEKHLQCDAFPCWKEFMSVYHTGYEHLIQFQSICNNNTSDSFLRRGENA